MVSSDLAARILKAREERHKRHEQLLEIYQGTLLSLTLNIPGRHKSPPEADVILQAGITAVSELFSSRRVNVLKHEALPTDDGPRACWIIDTPPHQVKRWMVDIEDSHMLGRLFDLDVMGCDGRTLHREGCGKPLRKCLVCDELAHACSRSRKHDIGALTEVIGGMVQAYLEVRDDES